jgi:hypothetical protein
VHHCSYQTRIPTAGETARRGGPISLVRPRIQGVANMHELNPAQGNLIVRLYRRGHRSTKDACRAVTMALAE